MVLHGEGRRVARAGLRRLPSRLAMRLRSEARAGERCAAGVADRGRVLLLFTAAGRRLVGPFLLAAAVFFGISICRIRLSYVLYARNAHAGLRLARGHYSTYGLIEIA
jgi:hypothetical protein